MNTESKATGPATTSVGRLIQSAVYRDGVYGHRRSVPVLPSALETAASRTASRDAWEYVHGSAGSESTAEANRAAFDRWQIVPRMLRDVERRDLRTELWGQTLPNPLLIAPVGVLEMVHPEGDLAVARAARALGVPMTVSTQASHPMERIAATLDGAPWFYQLYWSRDDEVVASMVSRAERAGASALVVTLDTHVLGWRTRDLDRAFLPFAQGMGIAQYTSDPAFRQLVNRKVAGKGSSRQEQPRPTLAAVRSLLSIARRHPGGTLANLRSPYPRAAVETFLEVFSRSTLTWEDLAWLRERTQLPIVVKGVQHLDDAARALDQGVDGIWVSNHGGRQVDGALGSLRALPGVVGRVSGAVPVVFDSGVRGGADVFKALALGATAVGVGRPYVYGLTLAGEQGVREVLEHLAAELDITMALAGARQPSEVTEELLHPEEP
ncbi:alpha-hydroxy-acid oxidizing protein [Streptomyces sp. NPDC005438]|uniref:alpha-hydroxy-acid oxidizing protein n=1 Tax=Streptomyces sp. NPDC005438 TaxID=3156880 RepID=UPI0033AA2B89